MAQTANQLSEIDAQQLDILQRLVPFIINERSILKERLHSKEICQVTFDELDPVAEEALLELQHMIEQIQSEQHNDHL